MKRKHTILKIILLGIPLVLLLLFALLQTPPGKALLAKSISNVLSGSDGLEVRIGRISGILPARIKLESLEILDGSGVWLQAGQLHCHWQMRDLLNRTVNIAQLGADSIELHRLPILEKKPKPEKQAGGFQPMELALGKLDIKHLRLGEGLAGIALEYAVHSGGIRLHADGELTGALEVSGDAAGRFEVVMPPPGTAEYLLKLSAQLNELRKPDVGLRQLTGTASVMMDPTGTSFALDAGAEDMRLEIEARAVTGGDNWAVQVSRLEAAYLNLLRLSLRGTLGTDRIALNGELAEFNLGHLPFSVCSNFTGQVSGRIAAAGSLAAPEVSAALNVVDFTTTAASIGELPDLDFHINAELRDGLFAGTSSITNLANGGMAANANMPCPFSLQPFHFEPALERLLVALKAHADLGILNGLSMLNDERILGKLVSEFQYNAAAAQKLSGQVTVRGGSYENYDWGVVVHDINGQLDAVPEGLKVSSMTASDGAAGSVKVSGTVGLWQPGIPLALAVDIKEARLVRRDEVTASLSGALKLGARLSSPSVTGRLVVDRADIQLDNIAPAAPRLLTDFDVHSPAGPAKQAAAAEAPPYTMDIKVDMPDQIYMSASVVESIWGGTLQLKDAPGGIAVSGIVKPRRGHLKFVGKKFTLMDDGWIELNGAVPPAPVVSLGAEYSRSDIVATLMLSGYLTNPAYTLTSSPSLPEDEILSQVLFGRDTSSISPYQAFQIAAAAQQLSGGLSGAGFMYQVRQALSIDTLEWREPDTVDGKSSVAAGKYLTSGLYVEVNSTLDNEEDSTEMTAEYEMTRHFSIETSTGPKMRPGVGLNWKNDY